VAKAVILTRDALKELASIPMNSQVLIRSKLDVLAANPAALANNVRALKGSEGLRLRVGNWRVIFTSEPDRIVVHAVGPRGSVYD
jgi:mRNA interferase RelE/StbE